MFCVSANNFLLWKKEQLNKGGDIFSLSFLLEAIGGISPRELNLINVNSEKNLQLKENLEFLESLWEKHIFTSEPIQYLCKRTYWRNLDLKVSEKVLIPRPETELIVDIVIKLFEKDLQGIFFAELGTGSGAISISLALENPSWNGVATDIDKNAIDIASENFINVSNQSNLRFFQGKWWDPLGDFKDKLDLVISNPPYIPKNTYKKLPKGVKNFEPKIALLGGDDGLEHIREIIKYAPTYLKKNGWLVIENHFDQGPKVKQLFIENGFKSVDVIQDFSGIGRFTIGRYK